MSETIQEETVNPLAHLQAELYDVLAVDKAQIEDGREPVFVFKGRLLRDAETALTALLSRFQGLGYTPMLRRQKSEDWVIALPWVAGPAKSRLWVHATLFLVTMLTTTLAGALLAGADLLRAPWSVVRGIPFAATLLAILGIHEMGHYLMARWHGMNVTLPYFIPVPPPFLGTLGAVVVMKSPTRNRATLFDVGFGGPIAGFVVAVPLLIVGLLLSEVQRGTATWGKPLLIQFLLALIHPHDPGFAVKLHPIAVAAYFGILITGLNLIPAGQFDGGHIAYAALGRAARPLALVALVIMVLMGLLVWQGWLIWAVLAFFTGLRHPSPLNDITPLDAGRKVIALGALLILAITVVPVPF